MTRCRTMLEMNCRGQRHAKTSPDQTRSRVSELLLERARLEEEVRQLRAAVRVWQAIAEQHARAAASGAALPD